MFVLKLSGSNLDDPSFLDALPQTLNQISDQVVIVHGGGKEITQLQAKYGIEPQYIEGLRVSDDTSLELVKMVLCGSVNTRIVERLNLGGLEAQGLSGLDRHFIRVRKFLHPSGDLGRVGEIISVRGEVVKTILDQNVIPVVAPICMGEDGAYNVNADHVAGAIGQSLNAQKVVFLTNVRGVLHDDKLIERITTQDAERLLADGVIFGGMIPKVKTALEVVQRGAGQVMITDLDGLQAGTGTLVVATD